MSVERAGVIGAGLMGSGIAEVCARAGVAVTVVEVDGGALQAGRDRIDKSLGRAVSRGKLDEGAAEEIRGRLTFSTDLGALADCEVVVEAVVEDEAVKRDVFAEVDRVVKDEEAVLASNTSSLPISRLATATRRPESVVGLHFFNPAPVMDLVELIPGVVTSDDTVARAARFAGERLGKRVIRSRDQAGFVVNALLIPYLLAAIRMLDAGVATREDIDVGMTNGCGHPMGPLTLTDLIGLDTTLAVAESLHAEFREPQYAPPPLLARMVDAGLLGRKSGRGFYDY